MCGELYTFTSKIVFCWEREIPKQCSRGPWVPPGNCWLTSSLMIGPVDMILLWCSWSKEVLRISQNPSTGDVQGCTWQCLGDQLVPGTKAELTADKSCALLALKLSSLVPKMMMVMNNKKALSLKSAYT